jgi:hypothetical protein
MGLYCHSDECTTVPSNCHDDLICYDGDCIPKQCSTNTDCLSYTDDYAPHLAVCDAYHQCVPDYCDYVDLDFPLHTNLCKSGKCEVHTRRCVDIGCDDHGDCGIHQKCIRVCPDTSGENCEYKCHVDRCEKDDTSDSCPGGQRCIEGTCMEEMCTKPGSAECDRWYDSTEHGTHWCDIRDHQCYPLECDLSVSPPKVCPLVDGKPQECSDHICMPFQTCNPPPALSSGCKEDEGETCVEISGHSYCHKACNDGLKCTPPLFCTSTGQCIVPDPTCGEIQEGTTKANPDTTDTEYPYAICTADRRWELVECIADDECMELDTSGSGYHYKCIDNECVKTQCTTAAECAITGFPNPKCVEKHCFTGCSSNTVCAGLGTNKSGHYCCGPSSYCNITTGECVERECGPGSPEICPSGSHCGYYVKDCPWGAYCHSQDGECAEGTPYASGDYDYYQAGTGRYVNYFKLYEKDRSRLLPDEPHWKTIVGLYKDNEEPSTHPNQFQCANNCMVDENCRSFFITQFGSDYWCHYRNTDTPFNLERQLPWDGNSTGSDERGTVLLQHKLFR